MRRQLLAQQGVNTSDEHVINDDITAEAEGLVNSAAMVLQVLKRPLRISLMIAAC